MGTKHYPQEYRERLIALARSGRSVASFAEEFEPMPQTIRNCLVRADTDDAVPRANRSHAPRPEQAARRVNRGVNEQRTRLVSRHDEHMKVRRALSTCSS